MFPAADLLLQPWCVCVGGGVLSAGGLLPAPFVHLGATHKGFTDLHVVVSTGSPAMTKRSHSVLLGFSDPQTAVTGQDSLTVVARTMGPFL